MTGRAKHSEETVISAIESYGIARAAQHLGVGVRGLNKLRRRIESRNGQPIGSPGTYKAKHPHRVPLDVLNGVVLIGSDAHLWPGPLTTAMRAFIKFSKDLNPRAIILNGDVTDLPQLSRHDVIGWEKFPSVADELLAAQVALKQIEEAAPPRCKLVWTFGNHDARLESRIANQLPELRGVRGVHLKDHFPNWLPGWSAWINDGAVVVKHRYKGGMGATRANALNSGTSMVTGHLHSLKITPLTDYKGTRYGVDSGCLAEPSHQAFVNYTEDAPLDWRSGFVVLTFVDGKLLPPELVSVWDETHVVFRGQLIEVPHETSAPRKAKAAGTKARAPVRGGRRH